MHQASFYSRAVIIVFLSIGTMVAFAQQTVTLTAKLNACKMELALYRFNGFDFEVVQKATTVNDSTFKFAITKSANPNFYYLGERKETLTPLLLGTEKEVTVEGNCRSINQLKFVNSTLNQEYVALKNQLNAQKRRSTQLSRQYQSVMGNMLEMKKVAAEMKVLDDERLKYLDSLKQKQPFFAKIVALEMYLSYANNGDSYPNEVEYFAGEYFRFVDFKDKAYESLPWVYESFKTYASTLAPMGFDEGVLRGHFEKTLQRIPKGSRTRLYAFSGIMTALKQTQNAEYGYFAEQFVNEFKAEMPELTAQIKKQLEYAKSFEIGGTAPDFTQQTPDGKDLKLSDLRGKVVLIDFWASWCGPCRRENPNVVKVYSKYKDKGFEILGVSLDNSRERWLQAIQQDGLTWLHVSDLKYWQNEVAQLYSVRSIPHTILLDAEGKIVARNLRGPALEEKLAEIFAKP
ncbi:MAG: peroxiredoxin family protein [Saprospiraceae bacterium]